MATRTRVLITGATGFLGFRVAATLLDAEAEVSVLVRPDQEEKLAAIADRIHILHGDIWNRGSLKGQARGHQVLVHLVGSTRSDPQQGFTYQQVNLISARNAVGMAISDGVRYFVLLSAAGFPGIQPGEYIRSKRDAEDYLINSGLEPIIVRAPYLYIPRRQTPMLRVQTLLGALPPFRWMLRRYVPLSVDTAARGIAAAALNSESLAGRMLYAKDLRRLARTQAPAHTFATPAAIRKSMDAPLDETPFGWLPSAPVRKSTTKSEK